MSAVVIDTETTGFDAPEVIELAWANWTDDEAAAFGECHRYKPSKPIDWGAMAVHNIIPADLEGKPPSIQAFDDRPAARFWIGHGIDFDWRALGEPPVHRICTLAMSRHLWSEVDSHSLSAMTYFLAEDKAVARDKVRGAHGARADVLMTAELLRTICAVAKLDPMDLPKLHAFSEDARVPRIMTFGKFKGQPVSNVDRGYMNWYSRQPDIDPYVMEAFRRNGF